MKPGRLFARLFAPPDAAAHVGRIVARDECRYALDVGCGRYSHFTALRPKIFSVGVDAFGAAIQLSRDRGLHDDYAQLDILKDSADRLTEKIGGRKFDIVGLFGLIEHLPKRQGYELLEKCEALTSKFVVVETPNGFTEQGAEFGNEYQRHLSGWFIHDFEGLGYKVHGTTGTRYLRGYASGPRYAFRGCTSLDCLLAWVLRGGVRPKHAYNLLAIKDVRGVPPQLGLSFGKAPACP
jgi:hypothetical protein